MFFKKVKKADLEAVSSRNADQERQENKMMRAWISFGVVIILLILLFFCCRLRNQKQSSTNFDVHIFSQSLSYFDEEV